MVISVGFQPAKGVNDETAVPGPVIILEPLLHHISHPADLRVQELYIVLGGGAAVGEDKLAVVAVVVHGIGGPVKLTARQGPRHRQVRLDKVEIDKQRIAPVLAAHPRRVVEQHAAEIAPAAAGSADNQHPRPDRVALDGGLAVLLEAVVEVKVHGHDAAVLCLVQRLLFPLDLQLTPRPGPDAQLGAFEEGVDAVRGQLRAQYFRLPFRHLQKDRKIPASIKIIPIPAAQAIHQSRKS